MNAHEPRPLRRRERPERRVLDAAVCRGRLAERVAEAREGRAASVEGGLQGRAVERVGRSHAVGRLHLALRDLLAGKHDAPGVRGCALVDRAPARGGEARGREAAPVGEPDVVEVPRRRPAGDVAGDGEEARVVVVEVTARRVVSVYPKKGEGIL